MTPRPQRHPGARISAQRDVWVPRATWIGSCQDLCVPKATRDPKTSCIPKPPCPQSHLGLLLPGPLCPQGHPLPGPLCSQGHLSLLLPGPLCPLSHLLPGPLCPQGHQGPQNLLHPKATVSPKPPLPVPNSPGCGSRPATAPSTAWWWVSGGPTAVTPRHQRGDNTPSTPKPPKFTPKHPKVTPKSHRTPPRPPSCSQPPKTTQWWASGGLTAVIL